MPCLKYIVQNATSSELRMLRGKTIECISLIGLAVGREKVRVPRGSDSVYPTECSFINFSFISVAQHHYTSANVGHLCPVFLILLNRSFKLSGLVKNAQYQREGGNSNSMQPEGGWQQQQHATRGRVATATACNQWEGGNSMQPDGRNITPIFPWIDNYQKITN